MTTSRILTAVLNRVWTKFVPARKIPPSEWAETHRQLSGESAEMSGEFSWVMVPFLRGVIDAFFEPGVRGIRCVKSAQIGWSESVLTNLLCYIIDVMPAPTMVLFPKREKGIEFNLERFEPTVMATPCLAEKVPLTSRQKGVTQTFKKFPGGWLKFVGSHSADAMKSSSCRYVFVEEPDDCEADVKGQGRSIKLLLERIKNYFDTFTVMGGTPTLKDLSAIDEEMKATDQRRWYVPCHHCGEAGPLEWDNVRCLEDGTRAHPVYGKWLPETAFYACPQCCGAWSQAEKDANVRRADEMQRAGIPGVGWVATAPFTGLAGFYLSDLLSAFGGASLAETKRKHLEALHAANQGDVRPLIEFWNNQLGLAYAWKSPAPKVEELEARAEHYAELTVPWGGLVLTIGVDVQGDRIALLVLAWGRGEECFVVYWGEIHGNPVDHNDESWAELERFIFRGYRHASGAELFPEAISVDSSDGNTSDAVYWFCRKHRHRGVMAIKGVETGEIYRQPKPIDPGRKLSKAARYGLQIYLVGTEKAKDLIIGFGENGGRLRLSEKNEAGDIVTGSGPGRIHWYAGIRGDFYAQVTSEVKGPKKGRPRDKIYWQVKAGVRNEGLDCMGYGLHASRKLRVNLWTEAQWMLREQKLRQPELLALSRADPSGAVQTSAPAGNERPAAALPVPARADAADHALRSRLPGGGETANADMGTGHFL